MGTLSEQAVEGVLEHSNALTGLINPVSNVNKEQSGCVPLTVTLISGVLYHKLSFVLWTINCTVVLATCKTAVCVSSDYVVKLRDQRNGPLVYIVREISAQRVVLDNTVDTLGILWYPVSIVMPICSSSSIETRIVYYFWCIKWTNLHDHDTE